MIQNMSGEQIAELMASTCNTLLRAQNDFLMLQKELERRKVKPKETEKPSD